MGEIADVIGGGTPRTSDSTNYDGGTIPWITPADLSGYTSKHIGAGARRITQKGLESSSAKMVPPGTVLFTSRAPIGYVAIASGPLCTNQGFKSFVLKGDILPEYVYWWLKGSKQLAESMASGTTFLELSGTKAKRLPIPVAPLDEQKCIVAEIEKQLSRVDEAVANLNRVTANLKRYKVAVLKAAVEGRLVETEAELARRENRSYESGEQLLQRILEVRLKMCSGGRERKEMFAPGPEQEHSLPAGWAWGTLDQMCPVFVDSPHRTPAYGDEGRYAIGPRNVVGGELNLANARRVNDQEFATQTIKRKPQGGDIVYSRELSLGWGAIVPQGVDLCLSQGMCLFSVDERISLSYFFYSLNGPNVRGQATKSATGSAHPHINLKAIRALTFALPPLSEQTRIVSALDRCLSFVRDCDTQIALAFGRTVRLRTTLLDQAFKGKLTTSMLPDDKLSRTATR